MHSPPPSLRELPQPLLRLPWNISYPKQPAALDDRREESACLDDRIDMSVADQHGALAHSAPERQTLHPLRDLLLDLRADFVPALDLDDIRRPRRLDEKVWHPCLLPLRPRGTTVPPSRRNLCMVTSSSRQCPPRFSPLRFDDSRTFPQVVSTFRIAWYSFHASHAQPEFTARPCRLPGRRRRRPRARATRCGLRCRGLQGRCAGTSCRARRRASA